METAPGTTAGASTPTRRSTAEIAGRRAAALRTLEMKALRKTMSTSKDADEILAAADKVVALEALLPGTPTQAAPAVAADGDGGARHGKRSAEGRARAEKAFDKAAGAARQKQGVPRESATEQRRQQTKARQKQKKAAHLQWVRNNFYAGHHQRQQQQQRHQPQHQHQHQQR